jgi:hypothetical protein
VLVVRHDGSRLRAIEAFDPDQLEQAFARHAEFSREPAAAARIETAATRTEDAFQRAWAARDWDAVAALMPASFRSIDRRPLMHLEVDGAAMLAGVRPFFEMGVTRSSELVATRGERLALFRVYLRGGDGLTRPSEVEFVQVIETDANGMRRVAIAFAPDALDAAYASSTRYHAGADAVSPGMGNSVARSRHAIGTRSPRARRHRRNDHRRLGWETLHGPALHIAGELVDLRPTRRCASTMSMRGQAARCHGLGGRATAAPSSRA